MTPSGPEPTAVPPVPDTPIPPPASHRPPTGAGGPLRGVATISFFADDLDAAVAWYTGLLGFAPYFTVPGAYAEFRVGDRETELGIIARAHAPFGTAAAPAGAILYWHVDDLDAVRADLVERGATVLEDVVERGHGFVTCSFSDPFGNVLGVMSNSHYVATVGG